MKYRVTGMFFGHGACELPDRIVDFAGKRPIHPAQESLISRLIPYLCRMVYDVHIGA
jgi:hypothetical protein